MTTDASSLALRAAAPVSLQDVDLAPISYYVGDVPKVTGLTRTSIYQAIAAGTLTAKKSGRRTIIPRDEIARYVATLPTIQREPVAA